MITTVRSRGAAESVPYVHYFRTKFGIADLRVIFHDVFEASFLLFLD